MSTDVLPAAGLLAAGSSLSTRTPSGGPTDRLRSALPPEIVNQVLKEVDGARARQLPAEVLEHRALELAAKGISANGLMHEIMVYHRALWLARESLRAGGRTAPTDDEIEAGGAAIRKGVDDAALSALVGTAPADRSLAVPLAVLSTLMDRGLPADDVVAAMHVWLDGGATDAELNDLAGPPQRPELTVIRAARAGQRLLGSGIPRRPSNR